MTGVDEPRERMLQAVMTLRACDRDEAEVIMRRAAARLGGYSHEEALEMYPLPPSPLMCGVAEDVLAALRRGADTA